MRRSSTVVAILAAAVLGGCAQQGNQTNLTISPTPAGADVPLPVAPSPRAATTPGPSEGGGRTGAGPRVVETAVTGLDTPRGLGFFTNGDALVTERDTLRVLRVTGRRRVVQEVGTLGASRGQSAALGLAIAPDFPRSRSVFFYLARSSGDQVVRVRLENGVLGVPEVVVDDLPHTSAGGSILFGPDDALYIATGTPDEESQAQDPDSLAGKILRVTADGEPFAGNPGGTVVYASGLRDVRGLAFEGDRLWALDVDDGVNELDLIEGGQDYGWPDPEGAGTAAGSSTDPVGVWDDEGSTAAGLAYVKGRLWATDLEGERLWAIAVDAQDGSAKQPVPFLDNELGRLSTVARAPDRSLWVMTNNVEADVAGPEDDRIVRLEP